MEQSGWSNQNGAESILGLGSHFVSFGSSESNGTDAIILFISLNNNYDYIKKIYGTGFFTLRIWFITDNYLFPCS